LSSSSLTFIVVIVVIVLVLLVIIIITPSLTSSPSRLLTTLSGAPSCVGVCQGGAGDAGYDQPCQHYAQDRHINMITIIIIVMIMMTTMMMMMMMMTIMMTMMMMMSFMTCQVHRRASAYVKEAQETLAMTSRVSTALKTAIDCGNGKALL
jgi:ABC-type multidrug transport system fused ATPase/permease subunit